MPSPWVTRAQANELPPSAHGARAYADRIADDDDVAPDPDTFRVDGGRGQSYTVASLAAALREDDAS